MRLLTVSEINKYIREKLEADILLGNLWIKGEISNFKKHFSGHLYFTLKDSEGTIRCVMFRSRAQNLKFEPRNGMEVVARGRIGVYERDGQYQLYVEDMQPDGIGALYFAFQQLKERLAKEGLFDKSTKKSIPRFPKKIAVITSPTGAAVKDIFNVLQRRCPHVEIYLMPVAVQGDLAPGEIAAAIEAVNTLTEIDVIILGRGGGSLEELWAFNTEVVARSIFASRIPIISAVGHETDFTIADFVADLRAPTPSAAAELAVPDFREVIQRFGSLEERLFLGIQSFIKTLRTRVDYCTRSRALSRPMDGLENLNQKLDFLANRLEQSMVALCSERRGRFGIAAGGLSKLNPLATLERGYAVCQDKLTARILSKSEDFNEGARIEVVLSDGRVDCIVEDVRRGQNDQGK